MIEMSQAEYARHRGVSKQAVNKLIAAGKIPFRERAGRKVIDAAAADFALGENRERIDTRPEREESESPRSFLGTESTAGLTKARTATEVYRARIAQLEYEERIGKKLDADAVTRAMQVCAERLVREIDQLPSFAEDLAAAFSRDGLNGMRAAIKDVSRRLRETLARSMTVTADAALQEGEPPLEQAA